MARELPEMSTHRLNRNAANKEKVADEIDKYIEQLDLWRKALRAGDGEQMKDMMRVAAARRKELY